MTITIQLIQCFRCTLLFHLLVVKIIILQVVLIIFDCIILILLVEPFEVIILVVGTIFVERAVSAVVPI